MRYDETLVDALVTATHTRDEQVAAARDDHWRQVAEEVVKEIVSKAEAFEVIAGQVSDGRLDRCRANCYRGAADIIRRFFAKEKA